MPETDLYHAVVIATVGQGGSLHVETLPDGNIAVSWGEHSRQSVSAATIGAAFTKALERLKNSQ